MAGGVTPRAVGTRIDYDVLPHHVRAWVDDALGARVVEAVTQLGGFSAGAAAPVAAPAAGAFPVSSRIEQIRAQLLRR